jgi:hypothetical protein
VFFAATLLATVFGNVQGVVHGPDHRPIARARVTLKARAADFSQTVETSAEGTFQIPAISAGDYIITVEREGFTTQEQVLAVNSSSARILHIQLSLAPLAQSVEVSATPLDTGSVTPEATVSRLDIAHTPGAGRTNSLQMITAYVPGAYLAHDQLHIRGGHQVSWLIDGVPIPNTNIASNAGPQVDPRDVDYLEMQRGSYSAEYGDRTYGVFNVVPRSGFERDNDGELEMSYGNFGQTNDQLSLGGHSERFAWYTSVNGNRSSLGLETPGPAVLHDDASGVGTFGSLFYNRTPADQLRLVWSARADDYEIPNTPDDQAAGLRDSDQEHDALVVFSWVHAFSPGRLLTVSPFYHWNSADYLPGPSDPVTSTTDKQHSQYAGAHVTFNAVSTRHNARVGVYGFVQHDSRDFLLSDSASGFAARGRLTPSGNLEAVFAEDQYRPASWLTLTAGLRMTHYGGLVSENVADPRAGVAVRIPRLGWVLRGFYGRYYQAPPLATIAGPLLQYAAEQGVGFLPLRGERDEENQFGISIPLFGWTLDGDHFHTHARNFFDHDALGNSNIFLPLTVAAARVDAWEVTLRSPLLARRAQFHLAYSKQRAEGAGAVTGGLTDFSPPPDGYFLLDHDQRHTLSAGGFLRLPGHTWTSANVYYGSGFPDDGGPARLPAHTTVDAAIGHSFGENWSASVQATNIANRRFLLDNSLTFGGTHYFNPREVYGEIRWRFHL